MLRLGLDAASIRDDLKALRNKIVRERFRVIDIEKQEIQLDVAYSFSRVGSPLFRLFPKKSNILQALTRYDVQRSRDLQRQAPRKLSGDEMSHWVDTRCEEENMRWIIEYLFVEIDIKNKRSRL